MLDSSSPKQPWNGGGRGSKHEIEYWLEQAQIWPLPAQVFLPPSPSQIKAIGRWEVECQCVRNSATFVATRLSTQSGLSHVLVACFAGYLSDTSLQLGSISSTLMGCCGTLGRTIIGPPLLHTHGSRGQFRWAGI